MKQTIILFNGPPRSGKDTATRIAKDVLGLKGATYRFAQPLKEAVHSLFGLGGVPVEFFNDSKDEPNEKMMGMTPREAYIWLSEEIAKPKFGKDFFAKVGITNIKRLFWHYGGLMSVIISDCGFQEEFDLLAEHFGAENVWLCKLERPGFDFSNDSRGYINSSVRSVTIKNDGNLNDFHQKIQSLLKEITDVKA